MARPAWTRRHPLFLARLTAQGAGVLISGAVLLGIGIAFGMPDVVILGLAFILAVAAAWVWLSARRLDRGRAALTVVRRVQPNPVIRGQAATVRLTVGAARPTSATLNRLARLRISEQAVPELCDQDTLRAQVAASADRIAVRYRFTPVARGRWALGPLLTSRTDIFGLATARRPLGVPSTINVWPRTVELPVARATALGDVERAAAGARLASADDSVLRDYVAGDDPRRVHWMSAARRGQLMVRSDESSGLPGVSVLFDRGLLPHPDLPWDPQHRGEWALELAASVAVSLQRSGHPVRIMPTGEHLASAFTATRSHDGSAQLLDQTLDVTGVAALAQVDPAIVTTARALHGHRRPGEVTIAVLGAMGAEGRRALAALTADGPSWAMVVAENRATARADIADVAADLRLAGWRVVVVDPASTIDRAWLALVEDAR